MYQPKMADQDIRNNGSDGVNDNKKDIKGRGRSPAGRGAGGGGGRRRSRSPIDRHRQGGGGGENKASRRVYVANVPFDVKWNDLKDLFREKVGNVVYCQLFEDEKGQSRGCGLVEFQDTASAQKAIETLHRHNFRNRELVVKEDLDCERDRFGRLILPDAKRGGGVGVGKEREREIPRERDIYDRPPVGFNQGGINYNTFGLSPQFLESLGITGPLNNRIFVANLDFKVGEKKLEEIFRLSGKVLRVRLYTDSSNNSKGHGTVEFEHPVEAVQAISMFHNQKLYGRPMSIRMDKYECEEMPEVLPSKLPAGLEGVGKGLGIGGQPLNIGKSLLNNYNFGNVAPVQPPPPQQPIPPPNTGLNAFGGMAGMAGTGNMSQLPMPQQGLAPGLAATPSVPSAPSSYGMPGVVNSGDRSMGNMGQPMVGLSGNPGGLPNLAPSSQNVLAAAQSLSGPSSIPGVNPALGLGAGQQAGPGVVGGNPSNLGVYGSYEREFRDDKYRVPQPMTDTIVVRNLPPNFSWQNLRDRFNEIGEVRYAELKNRGTAIVRFHSERDAQRAVDLMNGIQISVTT
ncbi:myelin expression factor 2 isoform X2 [Tetranychus urticae]|uniref:myelin expression factor 2 isoform X2 n=1 Tax=Tetranychus urticae TaxID=32264 RepID=UPI00077BDEDC|nr:myelin expression factor 2 isoform X2 [Tetranychus urticae]